MEATPDRAPAAPRLGHYEIDASRSAVTFATRHLFGLAPVRGTFAIRSGMVSIAEPLERSSIHAEIDAASFRTSNARRDASVYSPRLLDVSRHPVITFAADSVEGPVITGALTIRGVTRLVRLTVERTTASPGSFAARARARIDRAEFGVTAARGLAGRYLELSVEVQCIRN